MKSWGMPLCFIFDHEPEASASSQNGTATDFKNAGSSRSSRNKA
jgi:hypothetical protein